MFPSYLLKYCKWICGQELERIELPARNRGFLPGRPLVAGNFGNKQVMLYCRDPNQT